MSNGIGLNPLNSLSKIYLEQIAKKKKDDTYLEPDMKKRQANNEKARKDMEKMGTSMKNPHFEQKQQGWEAVNKLTNAYKAMQEGVRDVDPEKGTAERKARLEKKRGMKMDDHPQYKKEEVETVDEAMSSYDRNRKRAAQRAAERNAARAAGKTGVVPGVGYVSPRKERETYVDSAGTTRHKSGAKMEEVEQVDENRAAMGRINKEYHRKKEAEAMAARAKAPKDKKPAPKRLNDNPMYDAKSAGSSRVKGFKFTPTEEVENVEELYKGKHGQSDKEYADSRSQGGKMVSGDSKMSGAEYTHGRRVKAANPGMQPDVGGKTKPKSQGKMDKGTRADLEYRKANLKKEEVEVEEGYGTGAAMIRGGGKPKKKVDVFAYDRKLQAQGKLKGKKLPPPPTNESLDPVGKEDGDVNNDGKKDSTDSYLMKRRKAIGKAIKKRMSEQEEKIGGGNLKSLVKKATKRVDADVDGDVDKNDPKEKGMGEFVPSADGKKKVRTSVKFESYSWRKDLSEIMTDDIDSKPIKEKKVNNKIKINPKLGEAVKEMGGTLIEMVEMDEFDFMIESVYVELLEEGYSEDDIEEALEYALIEQLNEVSDRYYDSAVKASKQAAAKKNREEFKKRAVGRLKFMKRKAGEAMSSAKKKVGMASAKAQVAAYNKGREVAQTAGDKVRKAKAAVKDAPKKAKSGLKGAIKKVAQKVVDRMSEEIEVQETAMQMSPQEVSLQKKKAMLDKMIAQKRKQSLNKMKNEEMSIADQMRISREANAKRKPYQPGDREKQRAAQIRQMMKNSKKDTRTDAQKMTDATGPRPGSRYRGD